jgi:hypothetical protein
MSNNQGIADIPEFTASEWVDHIAVPYLTDTDPTAPVQGLVGDTGGGKTSISIQACRKAGFLEEEIYVTKPANKTLVDYVGVPAAVDGKTKFLPPEVIADCMSGKIKVIVLDEAMDCGMASMQNMVASWLLDKNVADHQMLKSLKIIWTGNESHHRAGSQDINRKVSTRSGLSRLGRSLDDLLAHAMASGWRRATVGYLHWKGENELYGEPDMDPREPIRPSPRQWENVSKSPHDLPPAIQTRSFARYIPSGKAVGYMGFLKLVNELPPIQSIIDDPASAPISDKVEVTYALVSRLLQEVDTPAMFQHMMKYVSRLRAEPQTVFVNSCVKSVPQVKATREYTKWAVTNQAYFGFDNE